MENSAEIGALRTVNAELQTQIDLLHSTLHKKEKEINRLVFANELQKKTEEELKKALHEFKIQEEIAKKEMHQLRRFSEITESDKSQIAVALSDAKKLIDRLQKALKSKDSFSPGFQKGHQKREFELDAVPSPKFQIEPGKIDFNRLKIPERLGTSSSPERFEHHFTDRGEELQYRHICEDAMKIVGCTSPKDFHSKLIHLRHHHSKYKKVKSLIDRISEMIVQCSPEGMFRTVPTVRQIWRWITKLLEEYMNVKQSVTGQALLQLYQMMGTDSLQEVVRKVEELRRKQ